LPLIAFEQGLKDVPHAVFSCHLLFISCTIVSRAIYIGKNRTIVSLKNGKKLSERYSRRICHRFGARNTRNAQAVKRIPPTEALSPKPAALEIMSNQIQALHNENGSHVQ
jgi:hypothetical protein